MVRELKSHRRGPQITGIGPYDPNLAPKPPGKWRGWWAVAAVALVVMLGMGVWFGLMRNGLDAPPLDVDAIAPEAATGTVAAAETPEELVLPDLPFGVVPGLAAGEESEAVAQYGSVRIVATAPDYAQEYLGKTAKRLRLDTNEWVALANLPHALTNQPCGLVEVALEADGFKADPASRRVLVQEGRTNDVNFTLAPLPAMLTVTCNATGAAIQINDQPSTISNSIPVPSLQSLSVTVSAPGYRVQTLKLGPFDPLTTNQQVVTLEREAGALRIEATVPTNTQAYFQGQEIRIRLDSNDWKIVKALPVVETGLVCKVHPVELQVAGFEVGQGAPAAPQVRDGQTTTVSFALSPLPATLKVTCNVNGAVIQINDQPSPMSNSIPVPSLQPLSVMVSATGYVAQVVKIDPIEPGKTITQEMKLEPVPPPVAAAASQDSLGMEFVEIPGLACRFSKYETRVKDYAVFAKETNREWTKPGFEQGPDHPAVNVSWNDATAFCEWLTGRERQAGRINANEVYRLPADWEWSVAVGLDEPRDGAPKDKDGKIEDVYPWGKQWPPPKGAGNYNPSLKVGENEYVSPENVDDYEYASPENVDDYEYTSPVGSFAANRYRLSDMGGNIWEWCEDFYDGQGGARVLRGASRGDGLPASLRSSCRESGRLGFLDGYYGFRCVLSRSKPLSTPPVAAAPSGEAGKPITVDLGGGMKMVLVWVGQGRFRMGSENGDIDEKPVRMVQITKGYWMGKTEVTQGQYKQVMGGSNPAHFKGDDLPVETVSWDDAVKFCEELTRREKANLPQETVYRLPTEAEWECAARGGNKSRGYEYSGGNDLDAVAWHDGNSGEETHPVGTKGANNLGLHDMSGNVSEWCWDWYENSYSGLPSTDPSGPRTGSSRVFRGGNWVYGASYCRVAARDFVPSNARAGLGFRVVLAVPVQ